MIWEISLGSTSGSIEALYGNNGYATSIPRWPDCHVMHLDGMNMAFGDGHVKWMSSQSILAQTGPYVTAACNTSFSNTSNYCTPLFNPFNTKAN